MVSMNERSKQRCVVANGVILAMAYRPLSNKEK